MPLALFLIVALSALAAAISHFSAQSSNSSFREALSVQAFYVADSAAQWALNQIMYPSANRAIADAACTAMINSSLNFNSASMRGCSAVLNCQLANDAANSTSIYSVDSLAQCASGELLTQREIRVRAFISD